MKIAIPAFLLQEGRSGLATYICNLLRELPYVRPEHLYTAYVAQSEAHLLPAPSQRLVIEPLANCLKRPIPNIFWMNSLFPYLTRKADLIHLPSYQRLPLYHPKPVIATVHDIAPMLYAEKYGKLRHAYHCGLLRPLLQHTTHLIAVSEFTKTALIEHAQIAPDAITVIYNGIDGAIFHPKPKEEAQNQLLQTLGLCAPFIVYVGRLEHPMKNHLRLIDAFDAFKKGTQAPHSLVLAGSDWNGASIIRERAAQSPYAKSIFIIGHTPVATLVALYNACDLMIFPSLYEGFGLPLLEALACGATAICSNTTSLMELAKGACVTTFDPTSVTAIAGAIENALESPKVSPAILSQRQAFLSQFTWQNCARKHAELYSRF